MLALVASAFLGALGSFLVTFPLQYRLYHSSRTIARLAAMDPEKRRTTEIIYSDGILGTSLGEGWPIALEKTMKLP